MKPEDLIANGLIGASDLERALPDQEVPNLVSLGRYELLEELGRGGAAIVYRARDPLLNRDLALKRLRFGDPDLEARFLREAGLLARLSHPGIIPVFDFGRENESLYYTMPLVAGLSMDRWIAERRPDPREAARVVREAAEALAHAHENGVLHRDVKPANILLSSEGRAQLADFGLGRAEEQDSHEAGRMTASGLVMGTPSYMAPELAGGDLKRVDARCDIYSLGAALYEALTSRPPFVGETSMDILMKVLGQEPVAPRKLAQAVPGDLEVICLKAIEKDPERRYGTAREFADDLGRFLAGEPIRARRAGPLYRLRRQVGRRKALFAVALAGVIAAAGILIYSLFREEGAAARRARASYHLDDARRHLEALDDLLASKSESDPKVDEQVKLAWHWAEIALRVDPGNAEAFYIKGRTRALVFDEKLARENFDAAIAHGPYFQANRDRAILDCQQLVELLARNPTAEEQRRAGELRGRIDRDLQRVQELTDIRFEVDFAMALLEIASGELASYRKAAGRLEQFARARDWRFFYWKGIAELEAGKIELETDLTNKAQTSFAKAEDSFRKALERRPLAKISALVLDRLGITLYHLERVPESLEELKKAIERDPEYAPARFNLAPILLLDQGDPDGAILQVERALEKDPGAPYGHAVRGMAYALKHEKDPSLGLPPLREAEASLETALKFYSAGSMEAEDLRKRLDYVKRKLAEPRVH